MRLLNLLFVAGPMSEPQKRKSWEQALGLGVNGLRNAPEMLTAMGLVEEVSPEVYAVVDYHRLPSHLQDVRDALNLLLPALANIALDDEASARGTREIT